ncbi:MAG TPA: hypothetical protein VEI82_13165, partial [Myxococcota bacterium]|nr:hypothetical protein [Myxococcota bacterium]
RRRRSRAGRGAGAPGGREGWGSSHTYRPRACGSCARSGKLPPIRPTRNFFRLAALLALALACSPAARRGAPFWYRDRDWNRGSEAYSAWFGDARDGVLYFGLSPFWTLWWQSGGDPRGDLGAAGDQLIGRFDLRAREFLPPLRARAAADGSRSGIWDVLAHSSGRIYYTTFYEQLGWIDPQSGAGECFTHLGRGFNELAEGPAGRVYATRYADAPEQPDGGSFGAVTAIEPDGALVWEARFARAPDGTFTAPKSLAVDPRSGEVWLNTDTFERGTPARHETLRLSAQGELLERRAGPEELQFAAFSASGEGWFAELRDGWIWLRLRAPDEPERALRMTRLHALDFVQDIKPGSGASAVVALWSRRAFAVRATKTGLSAQEVRFRVPEDCAPPAHRSLLYTAVEWNGELYATLFCGPTILRAPLPAR